MLAKIIYHISRHYRIWSVCLALLFLAALAVIFTKLTVDNSIKIWYSEDDETYQAFINFQEEYGNDDVVVIFLQYLSKVYDKQAVADMLMIEDALAGLDYVDRTYSYGSSDFIKASSTNFSVEKIVQKAPENKDENSAIADRVNSSPSVKKSFLTEDERSHLIFVRLRSFEDIEAHRDKIVRELRAIIEGIVPQYRLGGMAVLNEALNYSVAKESSLFSGISFVLMIVLLALFIRKKRFLPVAALSIIVPVVLTFGIFAVSGQKLNMITMILPTILLVYTLADAVHIMNIYFKNGSIYPRAEKRELIRMTLSYTFKPCFFASATTMAAYISLCFSPVQVIKTTGLFAFIGIGLSFISVYIIAIIGFTIIKHPAEEKELMVSHVINRWCSLTTEFLVKTSTKWNKAIMYGFMLLFLISVYYVRKIEINTYPGEYLSERSVVRQDMNIIESTFGPFLPFEAIVACNEEDQIITRENLSFLEEFQEQITRKTHVENVTSITDRIASLNQQLDPESEDPEIPDSDEKIIRLIRLYETNGSNSLSELTNKNFTEARISGKVNMSSSKQYASLIDQLKQIFDAIPGSNELELTVQGYMPLYVQMTGYITRSLVYSFIGAFVMIALMMVVFLKNIRITIFSIIANLIPVFAVSLIMVLFKIPLDMGTVMIAAIMLGIAVDDTMHFLHAYLHHHKNHTGEGNHVDRALTITSPALLASSMALASGFLILGMSSVKSLHHFGFLCAIVVVIALAADVLFLSSILKFSIDR